MSALLLLVVAASAGDVDHDGLPNGKDACRDAPEAVNGWHDEDGCPDRLGSVEVLVLDLAGAPVEGAVARVGDAEARTDAAGRASFADLLPDRVAPLAITTPGFAAWSDPEARIVEGPSRRVATLDWLPVEVHVHVQDTVRHEPVSALVRADGPGYVASQTTGPDGEVVLGLRPGAWTLRVESPQHQTASRKLTVAPNAVVAPAVVELRPAWLALADLDLSFPAGSAQIGPEREATTRKVAAAMFAFPEVNFVVTGHGDRRPELSLARAKGVRDALVAGGVDPAWLWVDGLGTEDPLATPWLAAGRAANRSVTVAPGAPVVDGALEAAPIDPVDPEAFAAWRVSFAAGADVPLDDGALQALGAVLAAHPMASVRLVGRSDVSDHDDLGRRRAEASVAALIAAGVPAARLTAAEGADGPEGLTVTPAPTEVEAVALALPHELYFRPGSVDQLLPESAAYLPEIAARLAAHPGASVRALGHTTADESELDGASLSAGRADAVRLALAASALSIGAVGDALPSRVPPDVRGVGGYVSFVVLPPPALALPTLGFAAGAADIDAEAAAALERLAAALTAQPGLRIEVRGRASAAEGEDVARERALGAKAALVERGAAATQVAAAWLVDGPAQVDVAVVRIPLDLELSFAAGSDALADSATSALRRALPAALAAPGQPLEIIGRAVASETAGTPDALGRARAEAVARWLIANGVAPDRLRTSGTRGEGTTLHAGG